MITVHSDAEIHVKAAAAKRGRAALTGVRGAVGCQQGEKNNTQSRYASEKVRSDIRFIREKHRFLQGFHTDVLIDNSRFNAYNN